MQYTCARHGTDLSVHVAESTVSQTNYVYREVETERGEVPSTYCKFEKRVPLKHDLIIYAAIGVQKTSSSGRIKPGAGFTPMFNRLTIF